MAWMRGRSVAAVGFSFFLAATAACGGGKPDAKAPTSEGGGDSSGPAKVDQAAPDLSIQTINGKGKISLETLKGKVAIVDFWATWCGPCKQSFPKFEELAKKHSGRVEIVGVSVDDEQSGVAEFAKEQGVTFPIGWDEGHAIANRWDVKSMPTTYILDASGKVRYIHAGFHDDEPEEIAKELAMLLDEPASGSSATASSSSSSSSSESEASSPPTSAASGEEASEEAEPAPAPPPKKAGKGGKKTGKSGKKSGAKPKKKKH